jgi:hypothetical protein
MPYRKSKGYWDILDGQLNYIYCSTPSLIFSRLTPPGIDSESAVGWDQIKSFSTSKHTVQHRYLYCIYTLTSTVATSITTRTWQPGLRPAYSPEYKKSFLQFRISWFSYVQKNWGKKNSQRKMVHGKSLSCMLINNFFMYAILIQIDKKRTVATAFPQLLKEYCFTYPKFCNRSFFSGWHLQVHSFLKKCCSATAYSLFRYRFVSQCGGRLERITTLDSHH